MEFCSRIPPPTRKPEEMMVTDSQGHIMSVPITPQKLQRGLKVSDIYGPCANVSEITRKKTYTISTNGAEKEKSAPPFILGKWSSVAQKMWQCPDADAVSSSERVITFPGVETSPLLAETEDDENVNELAPLDNLDWLKFRPKVEETEPAKDYDESVFEGLEDLTGFRR